MEVENAGVDPGTRVVMVPMSGQGKDCELWFEDYQTGTIKSRLNLLCLDIQEEANQPHQVIKLLQSVPSNALCPTSVGGRTYYSAVANTELGNIPGRAVAKQCWYSYGGAEYCTADFSWITAPNTKLIRNTGSPPAGAIGAGHQQDDGCTYYSAKGNTCWYAYNGSEHYTSDFDWIVIGNRIK
ncbi:hypothetical protein LSH36_328g03048 [Paralvinella palmiformis]|uniref:Uncharacterized protein n=1 Tax=Paralvinella palmiformis TaxID=53620 RepID=A0AAD9JHV6_9ANNE|nr:hypothetical protein LSH36_328g03048 [Paralvinella palmiformis]